jgi:hypothetical protein
VIGTELAVGVEINEDQATWRDGAVALLERYEADSLPRARYTVDEPQ